MQHICLKPENAHKPAVALHLFPGCETLISKYCMANVNIAIYDRENWLVTTFYANQFRDLSISVVPTEVFGIQVMVDIHGKASTQTVKYAIRIDDLILLNLASKLLKK